MKKNKLLRRISVGVAALALICTSAVATSFAKYQTTTTGTGSVAIAKWNFTTNGVNTANYNLELTSYKYDNVALVDEDESKLAPGTKGEFTVIVSSTSEVALTYTVNFTTTDMPKNVEFYYDAACSSKITDTNTADNAGAYKYNFNDAKTAGVKNADDSAFGTLDKTDGTTAVTEAITIYWKWLDNVDTPEDDQATLANGEKSMGVSLIIVGTQDTVTGETKPQA